MLWWWWNCPPFWRIKSIFHAIDAWIDIQSDITVEPDIERREEPYTYWKCGKYDGIVLTIGCLLLFCNKSSTTFSASARQSCPLHTALLNLSDTFCQKLAVRGKLIFAHLPVSFKARDTLEREVYYCCYSQSKNTQTDVLQTLHKSIEACLSLWKNVAAKEYKLVSKEN